MDLSKITLLGNVGADPRTSTTDGELHAVFRLVISRSERDEKTGALLRVTDRYTVVTVGKLAEVVKAYIAKGDRLYVEGKPHPTMRTQENGRIIVGLEIVASNLIMLGSTRRRKKNGEG